jgi:hypothetical protein
VRVDITGATVAGLASAVLPEAPNERRQVCQMFARNLHCGGQMFQAIRLDDPRRTVAENVADPSLLGTGEHGAAMVAERAGVGQRGAVTILVGCGSTERPPLYTPAELRATCERQGGWWRPNILDGYCEYQFPGLP